MRITLFSTFLYLLLTVCGQVSAQTVWTPVGQQGFTPKKSFEHAYAIDQNGRPWVVFQDSAQDLRLTVMRYDGSSWVTVGSGGFTAGIGRYPSLVIDSTGTPYVAFQDHSLSYKLTVMKFDGSQWHGIGTPGMSVSVTGPPQLAFDNNGVLHVAYWDNANFKIHVRKFVNNSWVFVGSSIPPGPASSGYCILHFDGNNLPYVAVGYGPPAQELIAKYDGNTWTTYGGASTPIDVISNTHFVLDKSGVAYITHSKHPSGAITIEKNDGTGWTNMPTTGIPASGIGSRTSLAIDGTGELYLAYIDNSNGKPTVVRFNGISWVSVGNTAFSAGAVSDLYLFIGENDVPYLGYKDLANGEKSTVMMFDCPRPTVEICGVYTDTTSGKNVIAWNTDGVSNAEFYKIYREDIIPNYILLGSVPASARSFTDTGSDASVHIRKYKLAVVDSCGRETNLNAVAIHKNMKLRFNYLSNGQASLKLNCYEGIQNPVYTLKRSNDNGPFTAISSFSVSGNDTTFFDANPPAGTNRYRMDIALSAPCGTGGIDMITSNIVTSWKTSINDISKSRAVQLSPNPAGSMLYISLDAAIQQVEVLGATGQQLMTRKKDGSNKTSIDIGELPAGVYFVRVNNVHNARFIKR